MYSYFLPSQGFHIIVMHTHNPLSKQLPLPGIQRLGSTLAGEPTVPNTRPPSPPRQAPALRGEGPGGDQGEGLCLEASAAPVSLQSHSQTPMSGGDHLYKLASILFSESKLGVLLGHFSIVVKCVLL